MALQNYHRINIIHHGQWSSSILTWPLDESAYNVIPIINLVYQTKHTNHTEIHSSLPIRSLDMKLAISRELVWLNLI